MKLRVTVTLLAILTLGIGSASAQSIGVYFDQAGSSCSTSVGSNVPVTWYILANLGGAAADGITGAEFRQDGTPSGWFMSANANSAANLTIGSPIQGGANIAFPICQTGSAGVVLLYTISGFAAGSTVPPTYLQILKHTSPSNPANLCPVLVLCDAPVYTQVCVPGGAGIVNGGSCTVATQPASWSKVKGLYN